MTKLLSLVIISLLGLLDYVLYLSCAEMERRIDDETRSERFPESSQRYYQTREQDSRTDAEAGRSSAIDHSSDI